MFVGLFCRQLDCSSHPLIVVENEVLPDSFGLQGATDTSKTNRGSHSAVCIGHGLKWATIVDSIINPAPSNRIANCNGSTLPGESRRL